MEVADLELSLKRRELADAEAAGAGTAAGTASDAAANTTKYTYAVEMRFSQPGSDVDVRVGVDQPVTICIDFDALRQVSGDPAAYASSLTAAFFADATFRGEFGKALVATQTNSQALRIRLMVDYAAPELLNVRWESLLTPDAPQKKLFAGEQIYFSRFLVSRDWRQVQLGPKGDLRALVAVANPADLQESYKLAAIDAAAEINRAKTGLAGISSITTLPAEGSGEHCTLNRLKELLRSGGADGQPFDILFLVCHGAYIREEPWVLLEDENGKAARTPGTELASRVGELVHCPRLVVLASCQSAGVSTGQAFTALGPQLSEAGVPAVVAMQGSVSMPTMDEFLPCFFSELMRDGQIDRAMAVARGMVLDHPDYWMPVLFMRLKSGRLWYTPGFSQGESGFKNWNTLIQNLKQGLCTPIIGPGILESLIGSTSQIVINWAEKRRFPLEKHQRDSLPQVAQFIATQDEDKNSPRYTWVNLLHQQIGARYAGLIPGNMRSDPDDPTQLDPMLELVRQAKVKEQNAQGRFELYQFLAKQKFKIYITTDCSSLLASALTAEGKNPRVAVCPWNSYLEENSVGDDIDTFAPSEANPLVYHLFGRYNDPPSLVLAEDDYFDFLIGVTKNKQLIPGYIRTSLVSKSLFFVGFQLDDWDFRIFYRSIMDQEGGARRPGASVGVQVDQESGEIGDPESARRYLETYFKQSAYINLYWGRSVEFIQELSVKMNLKP